MVLFVKKMPQDRASYAIATKASRVSSARQITTTASPLHAKTTHNASTLLAATTAYAPVDIQDHSVKWTLMNAQVIRVKIMQHAYSHHRGCICAAACWDIMAQIVNSWMLAISSPVLMGQSVSRWGLASSASAPRATRG